MKSLINIFKHKPTLKQFVQNGLTENGGNYDVIASRMNTISLFCAVAKEFGVDCTLSKLQESYADFFTDNKRIVEFEPVDGIYTASYKKQLRCEKGDPKKVHQSVADMLFCGRKIVTKTGYYNSRPYGVSIMQQEETGKPIIYLGQRKRGAEYTKTDSYIYFVDSKVCFHYEHSANFDEHTLWNSGTHAEFTFDEQNRLVKVEFAKQGRFDWSSPTIINFENGYFLPKEKLVLPEGTGKERQ